MAHHRLGVNATQIFFTHRQRKYTDILGFQVDITQFLVERCVGVTMDARNDCSFLALIGKFLDFCNNSLIITVTIRGVLFHDVSVVNTFGFQEST